MTKFLVAIQGILLALLIIVTWDNMDPILLAVCMVGFAIILCSQMICEEIRDQGKRR